MGKYSSVYFKVSNDCINCGFCATRCPGQCIDATQHPARIDLNQCRHCGNCFEVCPVGAVRKYKIENK